jgi:hypothetical protein
VASGLIQQKTPLLAIGLLQCYVAIVVDCTENTASNCSFINEYKRGRDNVTSTELRHINGYVQTAFPKQRPSADFTIPALSRHVMIFFLINIPDVRAEIKMVSGLNQAWVL